MVAQVRGPKVWTRVVASEMVKPGGLRDRWNGPDLAVGASAQRIIKSNTPGLAQATG